MLKKIIQEEIMYLTEAFELDFSNYKLSTANNFSYTSVGEKTYEIDPFIMREENAIAMNFKREGIEGYGETKDSQMKDITQVLSSCYEAFICLTIARADRLPYYFDTLKSFGFMASRKDNELYGDAQESSRSRLYNFFIRKNLSNIISGYRTQGNYEFFDFKTPIDVSTPKTTCEALSKFPYFDKIMSRNSEVRAIFDEAMNSEPAQGEV